MKAKNLEILRDNKINVPAFIVVTDENNVDLSFSKTNYFAVRSSFEFEDRERDSYAGQFNTFLNVPKQDIKEAISKVKKSYDNVLEYEKIKNIKHTKNQRKHSVIIQEMIEADYSGVIFTANPIGILNETVITVGEGLGSGVVEDKVETTTYYYNNDEKLFYLKDTKSNINLDNKILENLIEI